MITYRTAKQCGHADYGWLQARYTFSFGHFFDPKMLGYASLRVLNQEVLAVGASFQPRAYPQVDILNLILRGQAEYRDSEGNHIQVSAGDALLLAAQAGVTYSEHNIGSAPLTRLQLWMDACPARENSVVQRLAIPDRPHLLLASPDGEDGSLQLRQQAWVHHVELPAGQSLTLDLQGSRAYLQSVHGTVYLGDPDHIINPAHSGHPDHAASRDTPTSLTCGDGAFIHNEHRVRLQAQTPLRALLIDLAD
ncbi:pirin family protein [Acerihabitans arboris]|uniref:Pirin family protein n=1 Tax=Acerihabitans arboris TaxID=2691583 RepID=A0A845SLX0_9GAMM|nr:pirin family protein [Acerihabitans arboris]NDL63568.1 pirin family protein [Acerihabitans arboris]